MKENLEDLRANGKDELTMLFARTDQLMDNFRAFAFLNGLIVGLMSILLVAGVEFTKNLLFLRLYGDYTLVVLIGAFAIFAFNGEIYAYVMDKVEGKK